MKEKLIELLLSAENVAEEQDFFNCHKSRPKAELIADYLIENGVIVLPCNVGDTVYKVIERCNLSSHICVFNGGYGSPRCCVKPCGAYIEEINFSINMIDLVGKSIFLNRKEAERVLKGK